MPYTELKTCYHQTHRMTERVVRQNVRGVVDTKGWLRNRKISGDDSVGVDTATRVPLLRGSMEIS